MTRIYSSKKKGRRYAALFSVSVVFCMALQAQTAAVNPYPPAPQPDRIVLNVTEDPATSIAVNWRTCDTVRTGFIEIAPVSADPRTVSKATRRPATSEAFRLEDIAATYHSVTVPGLTPSTVYMYRVGQGAYWSEWFHTRTAGKPGDKLSFIYLGDAQVGL
ncbi:MAG TPA: fibronectin type III domain-containing protein, partial [Agriterribacter sp.]|nr:fibronectin type III domain-containing protein [Agriterribacter sp.]